MLKKLQTKFILILMSFVSVILLSVFGIVCCSNYVHDKKDVEHKDEYCVDPNNLILWGTSSGAHTALMTAFTKGLDQLKNSRIKRI